MTSEPKLEKFLINESGAMIIMDRANNVACYVGPDKEEAEKMNTAMLEKGFTFYWLQKDMSANG